MPVKSILLLVQSGRFTVSVWPSEHANGLAKSFDTVATSLCVERTSLGTETVHCTACRALTGSVIPVDGREIERKIERESDSNYAALLIRHLIQRRHPEQCGNFYEFAVSYGYQTMVQTASCLLCPLQSQRILSLG